jgi:DNA-binding GntR family transcriptional regulator
MAEQPQTAGLLKEHLAAQLKCAIVDGRLMPGQRVVEGAWAREFGAAQASVREAINLLISEGFLVKSAGRSARVPRYSEKDVGQIYEVRGALEGLAARLASGAKADLAMMESALTRMEEASARGDVRGLVDADLAFHLALAEASGNPLLIDMLNRLLRPLFTFILVRVGETRETTMSWAPDLPRHRGMINLIREGTPSLAGHYVEHCVGCFVASARVVWSPDAHPKRRKRA